MKLPNFRLYDTQATTSMLCSILGVLSLLMMSVVVFKGINTANWVIPFNPNEGLGRFRPPLVNLFTIAAIAVGVTGAIMGFRSLGHQRNTKQGRSWAGLLLGAIVVPLAIVLYSLWNSLAEPIILSPTGGA